MVQVQAVLPGRAVTFEEARPQIVGELRAEAATERVYDLVQKYEEARDGGATMDEPPAPPASRSRPCPR